MFRQIAIGAHPSVLHLTRPANEKTKGFKTVVTVDEIRRVNRFLSMTSHDGGYRVVIVDPADDMNINAANALLKNLEEPPSRTVFILISHSPGGLLPTIRSRCQTVRFSPLGNDDLVAALSTFDVQPPADEAARQALAERAGGSVRMAILLTQYGGLEIAEATDKHRARAEPRHPRRPSAGRCGRRPRQRHPVRHLQPPCARYSGRRRKRRGPQRRRGEGRPLLAGLAGHHGLRSRKPRRTTSTANNTR